MERGISEKESLERVRKLAFCYKERIFNLMMTNNQTQINDNDLLLNIRDYIKVHRSRFYGVVYEDIEKIFLALRDAKENKNKSEFPDFLIKDGFIEHFRITSSKENKKGYQKIINENNFDKKIKSEREKYFKEICNNSNININESKEWVHSDVEHNYQNLLLSLNKHLSNHLVSQMKYQGPKFIKIYLIEYGDIGLEMIREEYKNYDYKQISTLREPEVYFNYRMSKDKNVLQYLKDFNDDIDYVIFDRHDIFEIIKIDKIDEIIRYIPYNYVVKGRKNIITKSDSYVRIPLNIKYKQQN